MGRRLALVIGNTTYGDGRFLPLMAAAQDAQDLAELLRDPAIGGFDEVTAVLEESNDAVRRAIAKFYANKASDDLLLMFFSGHGVRSEQGELYLAQKDTEVDLLSATGLPASYITKVMDESRSRSQIVILDCCFSGAFARNSKSTIDATIGTHESFRGSGSGRTILTATDSLQYAFEGEKIIGSARNSVFTNYLIQGLRTGKADLDGDGRITVDELFEYAYESVRAVTPRQTPCKWSYQQQGTTVIAHNAHTLHGALAQDDISFAEMQPLQQAIACGLLLILNSYLAALGSLLWQHFPYWPAFMICGLACIHLGRWGLVLTALTPLVSSVLGVAGAPPYLYVPVNVLQALLLLAAFRYGNIDPTLKSWSHRGMYLILAIAIPSFCGGCFAWSLRHWLHYDAGDPQIFPYALWWTSENLLPAIVPGLWLHQVIGEIYAPFRWQSGGDPVSWRRRSISFATPWMSTLILFAALIVGLLSQQIASSATNPSIEMSRSLPGSTWKSVYDLTTQSLVLRVLVLALLVAILYSLGSSIRFAKRTWILEMAVSRRLPFFFSPPPPSGREVVALLAVSLQDFRSLAARVPAQRLVGWLNQYFDCVSDICAGRGGYVDTMIDGRLIVVFGICGVDSGSAEAILCSLDVVDRLALLKPKLLTDGLPPINVHIGVHVGPVVATEIGSRLRRQFALLGETAFIARELAEHANELPLSVAPVLISSKAALEAGLLATDEIERELVELTVEPGASPQRRVFGIRDASWMRTRLSKPAVAEALPFSRGVVGARRG